MRVFDLRCAQGHDFEGWFSSAADFDRQQEQGVIACPLCENTSVARLPSAPYVNTGGRSPETLPVAAQPQPAANELGAVLAKLKAYVGANTEDVGRQFPEIARRMHYGEESARGIRGRVTTQEAVELHEEGIEAVALPPGLAPEEPVH